MHSDLAGPMSEKLCDLFGRLVCVCVFFVVAFLFTRAALFIMAKLLFLLFYWCALESSWRGVKPMENGWGDSAGSCKHNCNAYPWTSRRIDIYIHMYIAWIYIFMRILYVHLLFYSVCSHFVQQSVDTINYQLYFHFIFLSLISVPISALASFSLRLMVDWSTSLIGIKLTDFQLNPGASLPATPGHAYWIKINWEPLHNRSYYAGK